MLSVVDMGAVTLFIVPSLERIFAAEFLMFTAHFLNDFTSEFVIVYPRNELKRQDMSTFSEFQMTQQILPIASQFGRHRF